MDIIAQYCRLCGLLLAVSGRIICGGTLLWLANRHQAPIVAALAILAGIDAVLAGRRWARNHTRKLL